MIITASNKLACALRELRKRRSAYPRWVAAGKMTQEQAERELQLMQAIADDYAEEARTERLL